MPIEQVIALIISVGFDAFEAIERIRSQRGSGGEWTPEDTALVRALVNRPLEDYEAGHVPSRDTGPVAGT